MGHTTTTKKVRLDEEYTLRLARVARHMGSTESDILRQGIDLVEQQIRRDEALDGLIEMAKIKGPDKERYRFR